MAKYFVELLLIACIFGYAASLSCLSCTSKEVCEDPPSTLCTPEKKYCLASFGQGTYFRGCYETTMDCDLKDEDGKPAFPTCYSCEEDNCNSQPLE